MRNTWVVIMTSPEPGGRLSVGVNGRFGPVRPPGPDPPSYHPRGWRGRPCDAGGGGAARAVDSVPGAATVGRRAAKPIATRNATATRLIVNSFGCGGSIGTRREVLSAAS